MWHLYWCEYNYACMFLKCNGWNSTSAKKIKEKKNTLWDFCLTKLWFYLSYMWWLWCSIIISTELSYCISFKLLFLTRWGFSYCISLGIIISARWIFFPIFIVSEMHCSVRFHQLGFVDMLRLCWFASKFELCNWSVTLFSF